MGGAALVGNLAMSRRALVSVLLIAAACSSKPAAIRVGSKNFSEQVLLGEVVAQALEARGLRVDRRLNLGGTFICDRALRSGDIDVYLEYTGTADTAVFKNAADTDPAGVLSRVRQAYAAGGLMVLLPLGFEKTLAILVRG